MSESTHISCDRCDKEGPRHGWTREWYNPTRSSRLEYQDLCGECQDEQEGPDWETLVREWVEAVKCRTNLTAILHTVGPDRVRTAWKALREAVGDE